jgi:hypothetical protein
MAGLTGQHPRTPPGTATAADATTSSEGLVPLTDGTHLSLVPSSSIDPYAAGTTGSIGAMWLAQHSTLDSRADSRAVREQLGFSMGIVGIASPPVQWMCTVCAMMRG